MAAFWWGCRPTVCLFVIQAEGYYCGKKLPASKDCSNSPSSDATSFVPPCEGSCITRRVAWVHKKTWRFHSDGLEGFVGWYRLQELRRFPLSPYSTLWYVCTFSNRLFGMIAITWIRIIGGACSWNRSISTCSFDLLERRLLDSFTNVARPDPGEILRAISYTVHLWCTKRLEDCAFPMHEQFLNGWVVDADWPFGAFSRMILNIRPHTRGDARKRGEVWWKGQAEWWDHFDVGSSSLWKWCMDLYACKLYEWQKLKG